MIENLLPASMQVAESLTDRADIVLFPEEYAAIERAVDKRRREYTTVRACARDALVALGFQPAPVVPGPAGAPTWPAGVVGSMTHCDGYRAAVVGLRSELRSVGIDAEPDSPLPEGVLQAIAVPDDLPSVTALQDVGIAGDRLLFSAKEAVYKAWFPLAQRRLDFAAATVVLDPDGTFRARLLVDGSVSDGPPLTGFDGRWQIGHGLLLTAVTVPIESAQDPSD